MMQIFNPNKPDINSGLKSQRFRVESLPRLTPDARWRTEAMRSYTQPLLLWFTRGQGRITIAGVTHGFGSHHAVFLPAGTMHGYDMLGQVFGMSVFFTRDPGLDLPDQPVHLRFREVHQQAELTALIDNLHREIKTDRPEKERALMAHAGLLSIWLAREAEHGDMHELSPDAARRLSMAYASLVERDFRTGKTIYDYAAQLGVTPTHLTRCCNASCGRSASGLLTDRLHFEARRLLSDTRRPVKDIATDLGFRSAAYFTRAFQKQTGLTPSAFRRQT